MIEIGVDILAAHWTGALTRILGAVEHPAPLMRAIAGVMADEVEENFAQEGRPKWLPLKQPVNPRRKGGKILQDTGQLAASIQSQSDDSTAVVGTNKKYARIHQLGGRTGAHVIRPRNKKALAFGGRIVKKVDHPGSVIPARPYLLVSPEGENKIIGKAEDYLRRAAG